ncbi:hypothetical protein EZ676_06165 [Salmonella enterica subsp. enterica serovar Typhimurium]|uniref:Uncharacterized protein n=1 Tax=Salmonella typhimurium TaxID=90371 RepID=A0A5W5WPZ6_SALTM|nr:hypothetical protein [Salmonella enterica subsp. enterica serovar Typhimurium]EAB3602166.1 hypothetical protein [Salmonella enterica]ECD5909434.1 hypothetical protein [Salmonella enterica subsp. enterica]EAB6944996.1 hypothetical protein [Salmonella enterica subsp. enterica serovar Typhimurium]EAC1048231.1 hypothetical protein [Salmonella enterica subsp. enterica serovar Typhimurium]
MNNKKIRSMPDLIYPPLIIFLQIIIHYIIFATFTYQETEQNEYMCKFTLPIEHTAISQLIYRRGER